MKSSDISKILNIWLSILLHFWQLIVIQIIWEFYYNSLLHNTILADIIELRKTWIIINYFMIICAYIYSDKDSHSILFLIIYNIDAKSNDLQKIYNIKRSKFISFIKLILILISSYLVWQWAVKITKVMINFHVFVY